jgi:hypothetical protein
MGSSQSSHGKGGEDWEGKVYFDPDADERHGDVLPIDDDSLIPAMRQLIDHNENILNISAYQCPLWDWQITQYFLHHKFLVLETTHWWWSVEKNNEGITIQRSKDPYYVTSCYRKVDRNDPIVKITEDRGRKSMKDFVEFLYEKDELNRKYHWLGDNCQHFAKRMFDEIAATKWLEIA